MATNKNATIRYNALDRCFRNIGRDYYIDDLVEACNEALISFDGVSEGVRKRQVYDDIRFMKSEQGWNIPLASIRDGKRVFFRYEDSKFSISNEPLSEIEANQLKESLATLSRFKGLPQFEWIDEIHTRLEDTFLIKREISVIDFEENEYITGREYISLLYNSIISNSTVLIKYKPFKYDTSMDVILHPYYIKQYNNRWFLFGLHNERLQIMNVALDRILGISKSDIKYINNEDIDFTEYFDDIIGVTIAKDSKVEKILLRVEKSQWPYVKTKPLHGSQKVKDETDDYTIIELELIINYEFISILLSIGENVRVLSPLSLKNRLKERISSMLKNY